MAVKWTSDRNETIFLTAIKLGLMNASSNALAEIVANWPADKGPAPTVSALSQQIDKLKRQHGGKAPRGGATKATRPAPARRGASMPATRPHANGKKTAAVDTPMDSASDDDEEADRALFKDSPTPTAQAARRGTSRPSATRSPSVVVMDRSHKRRRMDSPDVKVENPFDIDPREQARLSGLDGLSMAERAASLKKSSKDKYQAIMQPTIKDDEEF